MNRSDQVCRNIAANVIDICVTGGAELPSDRYCYLPGGAMTIARALRTEICSFFDILDINEDQRVTKENELYDYFLGVTVLIEEALELVGRDGSEAPEMGNWYYLDQMAKQVPDDARKLKVISAAHLLISLQHVATFFRTVKAAMIPLENFDHSETAAIAYKQSIDALGDLMCAQEAFTFGSTSVSQISGQEFASQAAGWHALAMPKMQKRNQESKEAARKKWKPLVEEVKRYMEAHPKQSRHSATRHVASENEVNEKTLYKRLREYWPDEPSTS